VPQVFTHMHDTKKETRPLSLSIHTIGRQIAVGPSSTGAEVHGGAGKRALASVKRSEQIMAMRLLTEKQVSAITSIPMGTLRRWRCVGDGPPFIKMGNGPKARVKYDAVDILAYVEAGRRYPIRAGNTEGENAWP
jgi:hypothetical protein